MYIWTYPDGEAGWCKTLWELLERAEYDPAFFRNCEVFRVDPSNAWVSAWPEVERAFEELEQEWVWDRDHAAYVSSPEKTGRV